MAAKFQDREERDLFGESPAVDNKPHRKRNFFLPRTKNTITLSYESIIFLAICFIMSCVVFFSLGVEKGSQDAGASRHKFLQETLGTGSIAREKIRLEKKDRGSVIEGISPVRELQHQTRYVIQIASFKNTDSAGEAQVRLRKEGYNAYIKKTGDFYQLYVDGGDKKQKAQQLLTELKKKYKDCYIKQI